MERVGSEKRLAGFGVLSVGIDLEVVRKFVDLVVLGWNSSPRSSGQTSPHSLVHLGPTWLYPDIDIDEYRPSGSGTIEQRKLSAHGSTEIGCQR